MPRKKKEISVQTRASIKYMATHTKQVKFNFNYKYDADILEKLDSVPNKAGYIKELIRADIAKQKGEQ
ncbi:MAG: hypothetical protein IKG39_09890 [Lachnospiraceae bacterium]|nr:hypothetical protein [Lachnospiraceae bacterium]